MTDEQTLTLGQLINEIAELNAPTQADNDLPEYDDECEQTIVADFGIAPLRDSDICELCVAGDFEVSE